MATRPCADSVRCPGSDTPIVNFSSEADDPLRFIGISFHPPDRDHWHDPSGFFADGCLGLCYSAVSQEDADFCAALQAYLCEHDCDPADPNCVFSCPGDPRCSCAEDDPDPRCVIHCPEDPRCPECPPNDPDCLVYHCPGDPRCPGGVVYYNQALQCSVTCPDGNAFVWGVPARKFAADSQLLADRMAQSWCQQQVTLHMLCLSDIPTTGKVGFPYRTSAGAKVTIQATGHTVNGATDVWSLVAGALPGGLTLHTSQESRGAIALDGVPTLKGTYVFSVRVETPQRDYMVKAYTITVAPADPLPIFDMPLDQAVYVPSVGGRAAYIAGVRGGYLFTFDPVTGIPSPTFKARISVPPLSDSSLAYSATDDRLYLAHWNDPASGYLAGPIAPGQRLYQIHPTTLAVANSWDTTTLDPGSNHQRFYNGIHRIIAFNGLIYGLTYIRSGFESEGYVFSFDPVTVTYKQTACNDAIHGWGGLAINGAELWYAAPDDVFVWRLVLASIANGYNPANHIDVHPVPSVFDLCVNPGNAVAYGSTKTGAIRKFDITGILGTLTMAGTSPYILCIRYNPYNGLIYAPDVQNNLVNVINPADDSATQLTGFDSPFDMVFTPTKVFASQLGLVALREVV